MKLSSHDWRHLTEADRDIVRQAIAARKIKELARVNRITERTVTTWRTRLGLGFVKVIGVLIRRDKVTNLQLAEAMK